MRRLRRSQVRRSPEQPVAASRGFPALHWFAPSSASRFPAGLHYLEELENRTLLSVVPVGAQFEVNTYTQGPQQTAAPPQQYAPQKTVAISPSTGNYVITWSSQNEDGSGWGVYAQMYSASGTPIGTQFQVNTYTQGDQEDSAVAMNAAGDFVITWASNGEDGNGWGVYAQMYSAAGTPIGSQFQVNTYTQSDQMNPSIAMDAAGDFVIAWSSNGEDGAGWGVYAQLYNAAGAPVGSQFQVNTYTQGDQEYPAVAMDPAGNFVVTWSSNGEDGNGWGIYAQMYNTAGTPVGSQFQVNTYTQGDQEYSSVAMDAAGAFVITWSSNGEDGSGWGVYAQTYSAAGTPVGTQFQVNTYTQGDQEYSSVGMDRAGDFMIAWSSNGEDGSGWGIYAQAYNAQGVAQGAQFQVNSYTQSDQEWPSVSMAPDGEAVAVWNSNNEDGNAWGVYAQQYTENGVPDPLSASGTTIDATEGQRFTGVVASFTDPDLLGTPSDYSATITWGDGNSSAGTITATGAGSYNVTGTNTYLEAGAYPITVTIDDLIGDSTTAHSTAHVADAALTAHGVPISATEGTPFSGLVATFTDANPYATTADFSASITWGDGQSSVGTITPGGGGSFNVSGNNTYVKAGSYDVTVTILDVGGRNARATSVATVADAALQATGETITAPAGTPFTGVVATFTDGNPFATSSDFTATIDWGDGTTTSGSVRSASGGGFQVSGTHTYTQVETFAYSVFIQDINGGQATAGGTANVAGSGIVATGVPIYTTEQARFSGPVATFTDSDPTVTAGDFTITIDWGDGGTSAGTVTSSGSEFVIDGTHVYTNPGTYSVTIYSASGNGDAATTATVADAPLTASGRSFNVTAGERFGAVVATFMDPGSNGTVTPYTATIDWGDGDVTSGTVGLRNGVFGVWGRHQYAEAGLYTVSVYIQDSGGSTATTTANARVDDAPINGRGQSFTATEGAAYSGPVATFTDGNPLASPTDFTATVHWGDGQTATGAVTESGGVFTVSAAHSYAEAGSYSVEVVMQDVGGSRASVSATATIADAPLSASGRSLTGVEGTTFSGVVATFTDENPLATSADFSAVIDWGDGHTSAGAITENAGVFSVAGTNTYAEAGAYTVEVSIHDAGGSTAAASTLARITPAPLSASGRPFEATPGDPFTGTVATFTDGNPLARPADFSVTIDWGDGSISSGSVTASSGGFSVTGSHVYAVAGSDTVQIEIQAHDGAHASASATATVSGTSISAHGESFTVIEGSPYTGDVASFTDGDPLAIPADFNATITWGDGHTSNGEIRESSGVFEVAGSHAYAEAGVYNATVVVRDPLGGTAAAHATAAVGDAALSGNALPLYVTPDSPFTANVATFTDANPEAVAADYVATIVWGDGTTSPGTVSADGNGGFDVTASHQFRAGAYVTAIDVAEVGGARLIMQENVDVVAVAPHTPPSNPPEPGAGTQSSGGRAGSPPANNGGDKHKDIQSPVPFTVLNDTGNENLPAEDGLLSATTGDALNNLLLTAGFTMPDFSARPTSPGYHWFSGEELSLEDPPVKKSAAASASPAPITAAPAVVSHAAVQAAPAAPQLAAARTAPVLPPPLLADAVVQPIGFAQQHALDDFRISGFKTPVLVAKAGPVVITSVVASVGYVLLSSRGSLWILSVVTARPLVWKRYDPVDVLFAWEEEKKRRRERQETLQTIVQ